MPVRALFVDAANTLLKPREPVGLTYARRARARGHELDPVEVEQRFREVMRIAHPTPGEPDGRAFWEPVVRFALGVDDPALFDELYAWYAEPRAWWVDVEALRVLGGIARQGTRLGIISNFDERLRVLYTRLALDRMFPILVCSSEVGTAKPDPLIFHLACEVAGVRPRDAVHVGDDPVRDVEGAVAAGLVGLRFEDDWQLIAGQVEQLRRPLFR